MKAGSTKCHQDLPYRHHPYFRESLSPSCSSQIPISPPSFVVLTPATSPGFEKPPMMNSGVYERLQRQYLPELPKDPIVCQILVDSLAHVMELEQQLEMLEEQTRNMRMDKFQVPEDLANVDVSEFKHLVLSNPPIFSENISI